MIEFIGAVGGSGGSPALAIPAATAVGDFMVGVGAVAVTATCEPPAGWTALSAAVQGEAGTKVHVRVWYKWAEAGDLGGTAAPTLGGSSPRASMAVYRGVEPVNPINAWGSQASTAQGSSLIAPSVTTTVTDATLVCLFGSYRTSTAATITPASPLVKRENAATSWAQAAIGDDDLLGSPGATGTRGASLSLGEAWVGFSVALAPAPTAATLEANLVASGELLSSLAVTRHLASTFAADSDLVATLSIPGVADPFASALVADATLASTLSVGAKAAAVFAGDATLAATLTVQSAPPAGIDTDLTFSNDGYNYTGLARVFYDPPVAEPPAHVRRTKVKQVSFSYDRTPVIVEGQAT